MCGIAGIVAADRLQRRRGVARGVDARRDDPSWPRRRRAVRRRSRGDRASASQHRGSRRRPPAVVQRGRPDLGQLQRRDLQPCAGAAAARSRRPPVPHTVRHRNHRSRLRAVGRRLRHPLPRHVCVRHLGRAAPPAAARPRPPGQEAALLDPAARPRRTRRAFAVLVRDQGDSGERPRRGEAESPDGVGAARHAVDLRRRDALRGYLQAAARPPARVRERAYRDLAVPGTSRRTAPTRRWRGCRNPSWWTGSASCSESRSGCA